MLTLKIFRSRLGIVIAFVILLFVFSLASIFLTSKYKKELTNTFNEEVKLFAKLSTRAVAQNFDLYFDSGYFKFEETIREIMDQNRSIEKIEIIDTEGEILYSSDKRADEQEKISSDEDSDKLRSLEASYSYHQSKRIESILYPYIEDWGAHKYSVRYTISPDNLTKDLNLYRNEIVLSAILLFLISFLPILGVFSMREVELQKEERRRLRVLNTQKDDFMTLVAHNLRTPVSIIKGYVNLSEEKSLSNIEREYLNAINAGTERLNGIIENILTVTSILTGSKITKEELKIDDKLVNEILEEYAFPIREKKLKVKTVFEKPIPKIEANHSYIKKAIHCLVDNAVKFNKKGGQIDISVKNSKGFINFEIKDTGTGIKEEDLKNLFVSFRRAVKDTLRYDYTSLGMGLYLAKVIIEAHGGKIWAKSEYGKGSTFEFSLPLKS